MAIQSITMQQTHCCIAVLEKRIKRRRSLLLYSTHNRSVKKCILQHSHIHYMAISQSQSLNLYFSFSCGKRNINFAAYICFGKKMFNMARLVSGINSEPFFGELLLNKCNLVINDGNSKYNLATKALLNCSVGKTRKKEAKWSSG